jgi:hypothetical protein
MSHVEQLANHTQLTQVSRSRQGLRTAGVIILLFAGFFAFMAAVQFATPDLPDNDGYYHIKMAYLMRTEGLKPDFPYLPLTVLNEREFADHHFLFHVVLIPFTFGDLRLGAKWASVLFASLAFMAIWWLFHRQKLPYAFLWALGLLAVSEAFIYRMSITRAQSLSLAFLAIGLILLLEKRYWLLAPLAFFYVWLYDAFPLLLALVGSYVLGVLLVERRFEWRPLVFAGSGTFLGILVNPYFPQNAVFTIRHFLPKLTETTAVSVGNEWYPYDTGQLLGNSLPALNAFVAGVIGLGLNDRRMDVRTATSLLLTFIFALMLFQSRRFIEYFPAFVLIFTAFAWTPLIIFWQKRANQGDTVQIIDNEGVSSKSISSRFFQLSTRLAVPFLLIVFLIPSALSSLRSSQASLRASKPYTLFQGASVYLTANTAPGERIFQTDWDDFPRLFFYNTHNTYLVGLDPTYMQLYDAKLYNDWVQITRGKVALPSSEIRDRFDARYVVSDLLHTDFIHQAENDSSIQEVYRDDQSVVYQIK